MAKLNKRQFLEPGDRFTRFETAAAAILPVPYEGGISWAEGTANAAEAIFDASTHLEDYDETLDAVPVRMGIATVAPPPLPADPEGVEQTLFEATTALVQAGKFPVILGGDHSVSLGPIRALHRHHGRLSVVQFDAHADMRETYRGSRLNHACIMARVRELTDDVLQLGIRSMSAPEAERIAREQLDVVTIDTLRGGDFDLGAHLDRLPDPVYVTFDVDAFDYGVVRSTGTPEPGGLFWDEAMGLLRELFMTRRVVGFDLVELSADARDRASTFAVAKLAYRMLGLRLAAEVSRGAMDWPREPRGSLF
jgi:agmatinase